MILIPVATRRGTARISAIVISAVSSVSTSGVLVTKHAAPPRRLHVDMVDPDAEIRDQTSAGRRTGREQLMIDPIRQGRDQHIRVAHRRRPARRAVHRRDQLGVQRRTSNSSRQPAPRQAPAAAASRRPRSGRFRCSQPRSFVHSVPPLRAALPDRAARLLAASRPAKRSNSAGLARQVSPGGSRLSSSQSLNGSPKILSQRCRVSRASAPNR